MPRKRDEQPMLPEVVPEPPRVAIVTPGRYSSRDEGSRLPPRVSPANGSRELDSLHYDGGDMVRSDVHDVEALHDDIEFTNEDVAKLAEELTADVMVTVAKTPPGQLAQKIEGVIGKALQKRKNGVQSLLARQYATAHAEVRAEIETKLERTDALVIATGARHARQRAAFAATLLDAPPMPAIEDLETMHGDGTLVIWMGRMQKWWGQAIERWKVRGGSEP